MQGAGCEISCAGFRVRARWKLSCRPLSIPHVSSIAGFRALMRTVLWLLPILCAVRLQAQDTDKEFWPEFDVYFKLNEKSRLFSLVSEPSWSTRKATLMVRLEHISTFIRSPYSDGLCSMPMQLGASCS